jgi:hypothetical protein
MVGADYTTLSFALKTRYTDKRFDDMLGKDRPLLGMINKNEGFSGENLVVPMIYARPQGISSGGTAVNGLTVAQANQSNVAGSKFTLTVGDMLGVVSITDKVMKATRNNEGAFLRARVTETDNLYEQMMDEIAEFLYGNSGGAKGIIAAGGISGDVLTLSEPSQAANFEVGGEYVFSDDDGSLTSHVPRGTAGQSATLIAMDRIAGTLTFTTGEIAAITGGGGVVTVGDFIFREGMFKGNSGRLVFHGLSSFLWPDNSPPVLYGMTRTTDVQRLAGSRILDAEIVGAPIEERLQKIGTKMTAAYKGPGADKVFVDPDAWTRLSLSMQTKGWRLANDTDAKFGYMALEGVIGGRLVKVYPDRFCPKGLAFLLRMQNWELHSMGRLIQPIEEDGLVLVRNATENSYEHRLVSYAGLVTNAPGNSGRVSTA